MKAVYVREWGGADAAVIEETLKPSAGAGEILVHVKASSINPFDWKIREGYLRDYIGLPFVLGSDFAGDIEAIGEGVEGFEVGTAVYGFKALRGGAYADYTIVMPNEIAAKPSSLSYEEAAAVPHTGSTALISLNAANVQAGQRVLIHGAAGGLGHYAVQLAKLRGAYVIGTASAANESFLRELGVDEFIDYTAAPFETQVKDVDVVLDTVGFDTTLRSLEVLKPGGHLLCLASTPPAEAAEKQVTAHYIGGASSTEILTELAQLIDSGKLKPSIQESYSFADIHNAIASNQAGHTRGKIVVTMD